MADSGPSSWIVLVSPILFLVSGLALLAGYLFGALPWGLWLGRWVRGVDVRTLGSGNPGATNVYRSLGPGLGIATLLLDVLKGAIPVWLAEGLTHWPPLAHEDPAWLPILVGTCAIAGHVWPVFTRFRGGKGVATTVGVLLALSPIAFGAFVGVFVAAVAITHFISVGSMLGALAFAATLGLTRGWRDPTALFGLLVAALVFWTHRGNIERLLRGEERRFSLKPGKAS